MAGDFIPTDLMTIAEGAAQERFERELKQVMANIRDINTPALEKRLVTLTFEFTPNEERRQISVKVKAFSKLAGVRPVESMIFAVPDAKGRTSPVSPALRQGSLFAEPVRGDDDED